MLAAGLSGVASGSALLSDYLGVFHGFLHAHELWILVLSAVLVLIGGALEVTSRRLVHLHGFPWLFVVSVVCFIANAALIAAHRFA
jgi:hypothetical protein